MKKFPFNVNIWILGFLAVVHAALAFFSFWWFFSGTYMEWQAGIWAVFALSWFAWPIGLALHPAQSALRVLLPLGLALPFVFLSFRIYDQQVGPQILGLPFGVYASPRHLAQFGFYYAAGWLDAKRDARAGRIVFEGYGFGFGAPRIPNFSEDIRKRCGIQYLATSGCEVNEHIIGHAYGRNDANLEQLKRRFGEKIVTDAEAADKRWNEEQAAASKAGQADAEKDIREGRVVIQVFGAVKDEADYAKVFRDKYKVELRHVTNDTSIQNAKMISWAEGYNEIAVAEVQKRAGPGAFDLLEDMRVGKSYAEAMETPRF